MAATADIFERLRADHDKHRDLLDRIEATSGETPERKALFEEFTYEAKGHAAAEEQEIEEMLNDVAAADMATGGWLVKFRGLKHKYLHHIEEEEDEMFPRFAAELSDEDAVYMRGVFERRKAAEKDKAEVTPEKKDDSKE